jgi:hypothetical protein
VYNYAARMVEQPYQLTKQILPVLAPRLGSARHRSDAVRVGTALFGALIGTGMVALAVNGRALVMFVLGARLFAGEGAKDVLATALALLCAAYVVFATYEVAGPLLALGAKSSWAASIPVIIGGAVKYALSFAGAPVHGIWAIAGSTIVGFSIASTLTWCAARKVLGWSLLDVLSGFLVPAISTSVALGCGFALRAFSERGWWQSGLSCVITCAAGAAALFAALIWKAMRGEDV